MPSASSARDTILFMSSNGAGLGHLTRILAIARRMRSSVRPMLATMSTAVGLGREQGLLVEHIPRPTDWDSILWHEYLEGRLLELFETYRPVAVVFDGAVPYAGLIDASLRTSDTRFVWIKRGLWKRTRWRYARRSRFFDLVIEPGELIPTQTGAAIGLQGPDLVVPPMLLLDESELLSRDEARSTLELHPSTTTVLVNLGAGNINDTSTPTGALVAALLERGNIDVVLAESIISEQSLQLPPRIHRLREYPISHLLRAFDFVVSATGYNSFHEVLRAGVPAIFVPMHTVTDNQDARASYAESIGAARCLRSLDKEAIDEALHDLLNVDKRAAFHRACQGLFPRNGAEPAMQAVLDLIHGVGGSSLRKRTRSGQPLWQRAGRPVHKMLRRSYGRWQRLRGRSPAVPGGGTVGGPMSMKELGTVVMVIAQGVEMDELVRCVEIIKADLVSRPGVRPLFIVDIDDLPRLRRLGVLYEYIPRPHPTFDRDWREFAEARIESLRKTYQIDRTVVLDPSRPLACLHGVLKISPEQ